MDSILNKINTWDDYENLIKNIIGNYKIDEKIRNNILKNPLENSKYQNGNTLLMIIAGNGFNQVFPVLNMDALRNASNNIIEEKNLKIINSVNDKEYSALIFAIFSYSLDLKNSFYASVIRDLIANGAYTSNASDLVNKFLSPIFAKLGGRTLQVVKNLINNRKNGLRINNHLITSVSGPIDMVIMKPTRKFSTYKNPIFILFGDYHNSFSNMCNDCSCPANNNECCYEIFSKDFLKIIDGLAKDYNVYFNYEFGLGTNWYLNNRGPLHQFHNTLLSCQNKSPTCFVKNVKWQLADIRKEWRKYDFFKCLQDLYDIIKDFDDLDINEAKSFARNYKQYHTILTKFLDKDFYKQKLNNLVYKQAQKMSLEWDRYISRYYNLFWKRPTLDKKLFLDFLNDIFDMKDLEKYRHYLDYFESLKKNIFEFTSLSVDLYFILRSFKTTSDGKNAVVSIGYFGASHTGRTERFLTEILGEYEVEFCYKPSWKYGDPNRLTDTLNRCMQINKPINLNEMIQSIL